MNEADPLTTSRHISSKSCKLLKELPSVCHTPSHLCVVSTSSTPSSSSHNCHCHHHHHSHHLPVIIVIIIIALSQHGLHLSRVHLVHLSQLLKSCVITDHHQHHRHHHLLPNVPAQDLLRVHLSQHQCKSTSQKLQSAWSTSPSQMLPGCQCFCKRASQQNIEQGCSRKASMVVVSEAEVMIG